MSLQDQENEHAFISYAHEDRGFALDLARALQVSGVTVFFDKWDIQLGDSIVERIMQTGLANARMFIVIVSKHSVASDWVAEELDHATLKRIGRRCRVIPVIFDEVPIPEALRTLKYVRGSDATVVAREIANVYHGVFERPPIEPVPAHVTAIQEQDRNDGLTAIGTLVSRWLLREHSKEQFEDNKWWSPEDLSATLQLAVNELNDAVDELEGHGYVEVDRPSGTAPFRFSNVTPTAWLYLAASEQLDYSPAKDINKVVITLGSEDFLTCWQLAELTELTPSRLNRAIRLVSANGLADVSRTSGTAPYDFQGAGSNHRTRQAARELSQ